MTAPRAELPGAQPAGAALPARALRLVLISPGDRAPEATLALVEQALAGGVTAVLLREPNLPQDSRAWLAQSVVEAAHESGALALIHNEVQLALECAADGVHAGHGGPALADIRQRAPSLPAGRSAHWPVQRDDTAADWVLLSPFRPTPRSHPRPLLTPAQIAAALEVLAGRPVVALGGLQADDVPALPAALAGLAVMRAITEAPDPRAAASVLRAAVDRRWPSAAGAATG